MTTPELIKYVKSELETGVARDVITIKLKEQGWSDFDIIEVFNIVTQVHPDSVHSDRVNPDPIHTEPTQASSINTSILQPEQPHKKSFKYLILILIIIILAIGGFVAYASGYFNSPAKLFSQSVNSLKDSSGVTMDIELVADASGIKSSPGSVSFGSGENSKVFNFKAKSSVDLLNKENLKSNVEFSIKAGDTEMEVESRIVDGMLYMSLKKAPDLGFFSLKPFENKWITLPYRNNPDQLANDSILPTSGLPSEVIKNLTDEQKQYIVDITNKASLMKITKNHLPEMIDGSLSYHFDFDLDHEGLTAYFKEMVTYLKSIDQNNLKLASINVDDYDKVMDSIKNFKGEAWIGIFDHLPHKIVIGGELIDIEKPDDGAVKLSMTVIYRDWNKPVVVEIPSNSSSAEELIASIFGGMQTANTPSMSNDISIPVQGKEDMKPEDPNDISKKSIMSDMISQAQLFYDSNNSYKGFCRDKTNGAYPLAITLPKNSVYKCNDLDQVWASWVQLSTKDYWCVGTAFSGISKTLPSGTSCPTQ